MKVRDREVILSDVVESEAEPSGWRAVGGDRRNGIGEDMYIAHPAVGAKVARSIDDEETAEQRANELETVVETHADAPTSSQALFEDIMGALDSPAYGPMEFDQTDRPERTDDLTDTFEEAEQLLDTEFEEVIEEDVERGFY